MAEVVYYSDCNVRITNESASFGEKAFGLADVKSVEKMRLPADKNLLWAAIFLSMAALALALQYRSASIAQELPNWAETLARLVVLAGLLAWPVLLYIRKKEYIFCIRINRRTKVLASLNEVYIQQIVDTLNKAVSAKSSAEGIPLNPDLQK